MKTLLEPCGPITPDMEKITSLKYSELSPEKVMIIGKMIDMWLEWAQSVPRIMEMAEETSKNIIEDRFFRIRLTFEF